MTSDCPAVRSRGLRKVFGRTLAVDGVDLTLAPGEFVALLGPSGCGKTTTLRLIAGFETPDGGTIEIGDVLVAGNGVFVPPERRRIGMVFQDYALFPHLDVAGNVAFGLPAGAERRQRVPEVLELVGLAGLGSRYPHELSGGQQQRVALARALAPRPALVLLDEPFSNLDAALRAQVRAEVRDILARAGASTLFVTHDQSEALSLADRVAVMWTGRMLQIGTPEEVYRCPANPEIARFVGDMDELPGTAAVGRVTCEVGEFPAPNLPDGPVDIFLRPEALQIAADPNGPLTVVRREFFGHDQRVTVRLASGRELHARLSADTTFRPGDRVGLKVGGGYSIFPRAASARAGGAPAGAG